MSGVGREGRIVSKIDELAAKIALLPRGSMSGRDADNERRDLRAELVVLIAKDGPTKVIASKMATALIRSAASEKEREQ